MSKNTVYRVMQNRSTKYYLFIFYYAFGCVITTVMQNRLSKLIKKIINNNR